MPHNDAVRNDLDDERIDRVVAEFLDQEEAGGCPDPESWLNRYPDLRSALGSFFRNHYACKRADQQSVASSVGGQHDDSGSSAKARQPEFVHPGDVVGDCRITRKLGQGGMGVVYQGVHVRLKDQRALKFLPRDCVTESMLKRFWREAQTAASIKHPNVISIHDVGHQGELHYIVMEYVEGHTVAQFCRNEIALRPDHAIPWSAAVGLIVPVLDALCAVHRRGLVHRDVKPSNIMVRQAPMSGGGMHVTLMDFGLVQDETDQGLTESGHIVGTPAYMSPEQALGWRTDERSDVFAVGATLYFILAGHHPHVGSKTVVLARSAAGLPPVPINRLRPDLPAETCEIVQRAMAPRASRRYANAQEMIVDLKRSLERAGPSESSADFRLGDGLHSLGAAGMVPPTTSFHLTRAAPENEILQMPLIGTDAGEPTTRPGSEPPPSPGAVPVEADLPSLSDVLQRKWPWLKFFARPAVWGTAAGLAAMLLFALVLWWGSSLARPLVSGSGKPSVVPPQAFPPPPEGMVRIPAGVVRMGAGESRLRAHAGTIKPCAGKPDMIAQFVEKCRKERQEDVPVKGFWIDKYEVTNAEYARFLRETGHSPPSTWSGVQPPAGKEDHPVTKIRHADAAAYAAWAKKQLPTAAQWTRAFRGDDERMYPWGDDWIGSRANVVENKAFSWGTSPVQATPLDVSPFGVYNMVGNASEMMRELTVEQGEKTAITKGGDADSLGSVYGAAPFRCFLIGEETVQNMTGFRCVIEEP